MSDSGLIGTIVTGGTSGLVAGLVLIILLLLRGTLVPGYAHKELQEELKRYRNLGFGVMAAVEKLAAMVSVGEKMDAIIAQVERVSRLLAALDLRDERREDRR